jgi:GNAT superfamily N-acetyltransferase
VTHNRSVRQRLAEAYAAVFDLTISGTAAVVAGVRCQCIPIAEPWATQARPTGPADLDLVLDWLRAHSPQWTVAVPSWLAGRAEYAGLSPWLTLPMYALDGLPTAAPVPGLDIGPARHAEEFLAVYGAELAPLVTPAHLAHPAYHHLVGRLDGAPVGCAKVLDVAGTAYVSAVTVLPAYRGKGIGAALSAAASRLGGQRAGVVWLHAAERARPLYERLGYRLVGEHVLLAAGDSSE